MRQSPLVFKIRRGGVGGWRYRPLFLLDLALAFANIRSYRGAVSISVTEWARAALECGQQFATKSSKPIPQLCFREIEPLHLRCWIDTAIILDIVKADADFADILGWIRRCPEANHRVHLAHEAFFSAVCQSEPHLAVPHPCFEVIDQEQGLPIHVDVVAIGLGSASLPAESHEPDNRFKRYPRIPRACSSTCRRSRPSSRRMRPAHPDERPSRRLKTRPSDSVAAVAVRLMIAAPFKTQASPSAANRSADNQPSAAASCPCRSRKQPASSTARCHPSTVQPAGQPI